MSLLSLEQFRQIMGFHPWYFWGLSSTSKTPFQSACNGLVYQYAWQAADAVGRNEITNAIETAEERLSEYLHFSPAPQYQEITLPWPLHNQPELRRMYPVDALGRWMTVRLPEGKIQKIGLETYTAIETSTVTYNDADSDGLKEHFTLTTVALAGTTNANEIQIFFKTADQVNPDGTLDKWRIHPVNVTINPGGTVTITGSAWLLVAPAKYEGINQKALDPDTAANFVTSVDVKRHWTDPNGLTVDTSQAVLIWETLPRPPYYPDYDPAIVSSSADPAAIGQAIARVGIRNAETGEINPAEATYDPTSGIWSATSWGGPMRPPDRVKVRYLAGAPLVRGEMDWTWQKVVARLAAAEMNRPICACNEANRELYNWQFDLSRAGGRAEEQYKVSDEELNNPFGHRRGHVYAWERVKEYGFSRGMIF